jgi:uncharacterized membrane protein
MKNKIFVFSIFICIFLNIGFNSIYSANSGVTIKPKSLLEQAGGQAGYDTAAATDPAALSMAAGRFIKIFISFLGIIFTMLIIYGGYKWMMAKGNEDEVVKAKELFMNATIGLGIVIAAYAITYFVVAALVSKYTLDKSL